MINVTGTLTDPMGEVLQYATIRVNALSTLGEVLDGMEATHKTDINGLYAFTLEVGRFLIEVLYTDEYHVSGNIVVDEFTPSPVTLQELINYTTSVVPPISDELSTNWEDLFNDTIDNNEWNQKTEVQARQGDIYSNEQKNIYKKENQYLATEDFSQNTTGANHHNQYLTYKDDINNFSAIQVQEVLTPKLGGMRQLELYESSNGDEHLKELISLSGSDGSVLDSKELFNTRFYGYHQEVLGSTQNDISVEFKQVYTTDLGEEQEGTVGSKNSTMKTGVGLHEGEIYFEEEIKFIDSDGLTDGIYERGIRLKYERTGELIEGFERITADNVNGVVHTIQADKGIIQGRDGVRLLEYNTETNRVEVFGQFVINNPEDFKGADGSTLIWTFKYSADKGVTDAWHEVWVTGDIWREDTQYRLFADESLVATGEVQYVKLTATDGAEGDSYYLQFQYTSDEEIITDTWRDVYAVNDDWRRQRTVIGAVVGEWGEPERIRGDDGQDGWIPEFEIYYGVDGTAPFDPINPNLAYWHKNLSNADVFKYERTVWWHSGAAFQASRDPSFGIDWALAIAGTYTTTPWVGATKIKPVEGEDYGGKTAPIFLYVRSATAPLDTTVGDWSYDFITKDATNISGNTGGWTQAFPPASDEPLWVASGTAYSISDVDTSIDNWDVDLMSANGLKYSTAYLYQITDAISSAPDLPTIVLDFNFKTQRIVTTPNEGWSVNLPSNTVEGNVIWVTVAPVTASAEITVEPVAVNDWEEAVVLVANSYSSFKSTVFKRTNTDISSSPPTGGSYNDPVPSGWEDGVPTGELQLWASTRIFSSTGAVPQQSIWTDPVIMTDTATLDFEYSDIAENPSDPTTTPANWHNIATVDAIWLAQRTKYNGVWDAWQITKIKGEKGDDGIAGLDGVSGINGLNGSDGISILWQGTFASHIVSPEEGWAYRNSTDGISYVYTGGAWYQMTIDGVDGSVGINGDDGISVDFRGDFTTAPSNPQLNWAYRDTDNGIVYIYNGTAWEVMILDGSDGIDGTNGVDGAAGPQGVAGAAGADGVTTYTWIRYADDASGGGISNFPTDKEYIGLAYNKTSSTESNTPGDYTWSLILGPQGDTGVEGDPGEDGITHYTWIKYSDNADGTGLYDAPTVDTEYIGIAPNKLVAAESNDKTDYVWSKFKGDIGDDGPQGVAGDPGADGVTTYTWIKYADDDVGTGLHNDPTGKDYIGFAYNKTGAIESSTPGDYIWSLILGPQGDTGVQGPDGADGTTTYTWIRYSDVANGSPNYDTPTVDTRYIGIATNKTTATESTVNTDYLWSLFKGDDGTDGIQGLQGDQGVQGIQGDDGADGTSTYFHIAYADAIDGTGFHQSPAGKAYIGTYVDSTATDAGSGSGLWEWQLVLGAQGNDGSQGIAGNDGSDGVTYYLHIAYATDDAGTGFDVSDSIGKTYIGQYVDTNASDSTTWSDYSWSLIKGADGLSVFITYHDNEIDNAPSTPTGDGTTGGWHTNFTADINWMSQKVADSATSGTWGAPLAITGADGADGTDGADGAVGVTGNHGQGSFIVELSTGTDHTTYDYDTNIVSIANRSAQEGDIITFIVGTTTTSHANDGTFSYIRGETDTSSLNADWTAFTFIVNGDAIIHGTLAAEALVSHSITADQIEALTITAAEIAANTITAAKITANTITASEIAASAITVSELAADSVNASKIVANTITASEIAVDAITASELAVDSVTITSIADNAVDTARLIVNAVSEVTVGTGSSSATAAPSVPTGGNHVVILMASAEHYGAGGNGPDLVIKKGSTWLGSVWLGSNVIDELSYSTQNRSVIGIDTAPSVGTNTYTATRTGGQGTTDDYKLIALVIKR